MAKRSVSIAGSGRFFYIIREKIITIITKQGALWEEMTGKTRIKNAGGNVNCTKMHKTAPRN